MEAKACVRGLLALFFIFPMAAQAALFSSVSVGVGRDVHKGSDVSMLRVAAQIPWQKRWGESGDWVWTGAWEAEVSAWHGNRGSTGNANLVEVGFRRNVGVHGGDLGRIDRAFQRPDGQIAHRRQCDHTQHADENAGNDQQSACFARQDFAPDLGNARIEQHQQPAPDSFTTI